VISRVSVANRALTSHCPDDAKPYREALGLKAKK
jgi:hypothetical protein